MPLPERKRLYHGTPGWVKPGEVFFITINGKERGLNQFAKAKIAKSVFESVEKLNTKQTWWCSLMLLMPDHLHALISFPHDQNMKQVIGLFKSYQNRFLGIEWQDGFFDHRLRDDREYELKADYIRMNPLRADVCESPKSWPYVWEPESQR